MADPTELLQKLATCWCTALGESVGGAPATCCMVSSDPVIPTCCDGFGWVRMVGLAAVYPGSGQPTRCNHPTWAMHVELGISRCAVCIDDGLQNPCCDNEAAAINLQMGDFAAFTRALGCCLLARPADPYADSVSSDQVRIGSWVVEDPSGGCVTARGTATISFAMHCTCP